MKYDEANKDNIHSIVSDGVLRGLTRGEIAFNLGISERTLQRWTNRYAELEEVIDQAKKRRKFACIAVEINEEAYTLAEKIVDSVIEEVGEENINRDFQIGRQYSYLMELLKNKNKEIKEHE